MSGAIILALSLAFTSCDDILGEWDKPAPNPVVPTPEPEPTPTVSATGITLDQSFKLIKLSDASVTITATITPSDATDKTIWTTGDDTVAKVVDGVVTPVGKGIATITAQAGDQTATCEIFVGEVVDLSTKTADYPANDFDILTEALNASYKLTIPDGAKVAFDGLTTSNTVTCSGDATIILVDGSTNTVDASAIDQAAGIKVGGSGTTLTINAETAGTGSLFAKGGSEGAGIGTRSGYNSTATCGDITITGGTVIATGGYYSAGIGTGYAGSSYADAYQTCGNILISGGTVTANGGNSAAGIGTGSSESMAPRKAYQVCGTITITTGVTCVTATKGISSPNSIGKGYYGYNCTQTIGAITIGGVVKDQSEFAAVTYTYPAP